LRALLVHIFTPDLLFFPLVSHSWRLAFTHRFTAGVPQAFHLTPSVHLPANQSANSSSKPLISFFSCELACPAAPPSGFTSPDAPHLPAHICPLFRRVHKYVCLRNSPYPNFLSDLISLFFMIFKGGYPFQKLFLSWVQVSLRINDRGDFSGGSSLILSFVGNFFFSRSFYWISS